MQISLVARGFIICTALVLSCQSSLAASATVDTLRVWRAPDHTRVVFDVSNAVQHKIFTLKNPERLVIDINNTDLRAGLSPPDFKGTTIQGIRSGRPSTGVLRLVLDLNQSINPRSFVLAPNNVYGHRLVVDLYNRFDQSTPSPISPLTPVRSEPLPKSTASVTTVPSTSIPVIAIDAGHGGEDPGAIGKRRTREKKVTLQIAKQLKKLIDADPQLNSVLTRKSDYYISLRGRTRLARKAQADVFISIHADAAPRRSVRGSSVYTLSSRGASSEMAKLLANKANASDLVGGVSMRDKDKVLAKVLWDLSMTKTKSDSAVLGKSVLRELSRVGPVLKPKLEHAGFAVLKSADIPSILVETAFISNPKEEKLLKTRSHQKKLARAIYHGVKRYLNQSDTIVSSTPTKPVIHRVRRGESLSLIAARYNVSVKNLKKTNHLKTSVVRIGQRLKIPENSDS